MSNTYLFTFTQIERHGFSDRGFSESMEINDARDFEITAENYEEAREAFFKRCGDVPDFECQRNGEREALTDSQAEGREDEERGA